MSTEILVLTRSLNALPQAGRREAFLEEAIAIGDRLAREAVFADGRCNWMTRSINYPGQTPPGKLPTVETLNPSVYSGTAGVALFLARVHAYSDDPDHRRIALGAIRQALANPGHLDLVAGSEAASRAWRFGYYLGRVGIYAAAAEVGERLGEPELLEEATRGIRDLWETRGREALVDVMFGHGSGIPALLYLHDVTGEQRAYDLAHELGHALVKVADVDEETYSWPGEVASGAGEDHTANLTGFSHGTAGIGWGLSLLAEKTGDPVIEEAARGAFAYEQRHYVPDKRNWPLFRKPAGHDHDHDHDEGSDLDPVEQDGGKGDQGLPPHRFMVAWCHGAPGIGISRGRPSRILNDGSLLEDARNAAITTERALLEALDFPGRDFSMCHGVGGLAECLHVIETEINEPTALAHARRVGKWAIDRFGAEQGVEWPLSTPVGLHPPLVTGGAGVGHWLLRLYDPDLPTILLPHHPRG